MTKQEIINAINATIVANGQKGISAESLNNILNEMVNATPEGGSGGGTEFVEVRADFFGVGFTDEDKAINAAAFAKAASGNDYIYYISLDGFPILSIAGGFISDENEDGTITNLLNILFESVVLDMYGVGPISIAIFENGEALIENMQSMRSYPIDMSNVTNIASLLYTFKSYTISDAYLYCRNVPVIGLHVSGPSVGVGGIISYMEGDVAGVTGFYQDNLTGAIYMISATADDFKLFQYKNGIVTKSVSDRNLQLFSSDKPELVSFIFQYSETEKYSIISANTSNDDYYTFVIYRNGAFENWRVNSDGTAEQITA